MPRIRAAVRNSLIALTLSTFASVGVATSVSAQTDLDCWQFASWGDAQATYESTVAQSGWDWMLLDEDGDGLACECLYYGFQCWTPYQ